MAVPGGLGLTPPHSLLALLRPCPLGSWVIGKLGGVWEARGIMPGFGVEPSLRLREKEPVIN